MKRLLAEEIPHLRAYARSLCKDATRADDLVQETLLKAIANAEKFNAGSNLRAWLFTILRNHFISEQRRDRRLVQLPENADDLIEGVPGNQEAAVACEALCRALHAIPHRFREALVLVGAAGFSYEETARIVGCEIGTVKSRVCRGRRALRQALDGGDALPAPDQAQSTLAWLQEVMRPVVAPVVGTVTRRLRSQEKAEAEPGPGARPTRQPVARR